MKKLNLLLLGILLCGFALSSNAQSDTRAFENTWNIRVNCDGVVDVISGQMHGHVVDHYNPQTGVFEWYKFNFFFDEFVSENTGEVFSGSYFNKGGLVGDRYWTMRFNLRGDQGSHILVTVIWFYDASTNTWTRIKKSAKCM
ncbi:MAG: hypothetical protein ABFS38_14375 [Bacteroidota bacterium]